MPGENFSFLVALAIVAFISALANARWELTQVLAVPLWLGLAILLITAYAIDVSGTLASWIARGPRVHTGSFVAHWLMRLAVQVALLAVSTAIGFVVDRRWITGPQRS
ncbi:MAG: hypothetical protein P4L98_03980 [Ancalomicrobiaceae bacterium]|nr:hypothetical protein [Ancalomicrobiaceae bacterium]